MSCDITLKEQGFRFTPQRRLILDIIHSTNARLSAEGIVHEVRDRMPGVNKSTVYRTLELLERLGCVFKSESDNGTIYHHAEEGHHHHLVCRACGKTIDCEVAAFLPLERALDGKYGFRVDLNHVVMNGLCHECKSKAN
jgi:Fur family ferric uptake transcriptional regulator